MGRRRVFGRRDGPVAPLQHPHPIQAAVERAAPPLPSDLPQPLLDFLGRCLKFDPSQRPAVSEVSGNPPICP